MLRPRSAGTRRTSLDGTFAWRDTNGNVWTCFDEDAELDLRPTELVPGTRVRWTAYSFTPLSATEFGTVVSSDEFEKAHGFTLPESRVAWKDDAGHYWHTSSDDLQAVPTFEEATGIDKALFDYAMAKGSRVGEWAYWGPPIEQVEARSDRFGMKSGNLIPGVKGSIRDAYEKQGVYDLQLTSSLLVEYGVKTLPEIIKHRRDMDGAYEWCPLCKEEVARGEGRYRKVYRHGKRCDLAPLLFAERRSW